MAETGKLYGLGLGPRRSRAIDPQAYRILQAVPIVAYPASPDGRCISRAIVAEYLRPEQIEIPMVLPFKLEESSQPYYDKKWLKILLATQCKVRMSRCLCEGDPFFYGTFMYTFNRLAPRFPTEVVPGVSSVMASAEMLGTPLTYRNDVFMAIMGTLPAKSLPIASNRLMQQ